MPRARSVRRARERPRGNREVEDLGVAEGGRATARREHRRCSHGPWRSARRTPRSNALGLRAPPRRSRLRSRNFTDSLNRDLVSPKGDTDRSLAELRDPYPRGFTHSNREDALVVGGIDQAGGCRTQLGLERPDLHRIARSPGGISRRATRRVYASMRVSRAVDPGGGAPRGSGKKAWGSLVTPWIRCARAYG